MINDTPPQLPLRVSLTRHDGRMVQGSNAGIKRNRRPTGTKAHARKLFFDPATDAELTAACEASGKVSRSLYLELLLAQIKSEHGQLPVLSPEIDGSEVPKTTAA